MGSGASTEHHSLIEGAHMTTSKWCARAPTTAVVGVQTVKEHTLGECKSEDIVSMTTRDRRHGSGKSVKQEGDAKSVTFEESSVVKLADAGMQSMRETCTMEKGKYPMGQGNQADAEDVSHFLFQLYKGGCEMIWQEVKQFNCKQLEAERWSDYMVDKGIVLNYVYRSMFQGRLASTAGMTQQAEEGLVMIIDQISLMVQVRFFLLQMGLWKEDIEDEETEEKVQNLTSTPGSVEDAPWDASKVQEGLQPEKAAVGDELQQGVWGGHYKRWQA